MHWTLYKRREKIRKLLGKQKKSSEQEVDIIDLKYAETRQFNNPLDIEWVRIYLEYLLSTAWIPFLVQESNTQEVQSGPTIGHKDLR